MSFNLATLFVEFAVKGVDAVKAALGGVALDAGGVASATAAAAVATNGLAAAAERSASATAAATRNAAAMAAALAAPAPSAPARAGQAGKGAAASGTPAPAAVNALSSAVNAALAARDPSALAAALAKVGAASQGVAKDAGLAARALTAATHDVAAARGPDELAAALGKVRSATAAMAAENAEAAEKSKQLAGVMGQVGNAAAWGFAAASASLGGFVRAGIAASSMGAVFSFQMQEISRQVASLFIPEIAKASAALQGVVNWFHGLTGAQQRNLGLWISGAVAALGMAAVFPRIVAGVQAVTGAWKALSAAFTVGLASTGIGAVLPILGLVAAGVAGVLIGTEQGRASLAQMGAALKDVAAAFASLGPAAKPFIDVLTNGLAALVKQLAAEVKLIADAIGWVESQEKKRTLLGRVWQAAKGLGDEDNQAKFHALATGKNSWVFGPLASLVAKLTEGGGEEKSRPRQELGYPVTGFESLEQSWERLALASMKSSFAGKDPAEKTADNTGGTKSVLEDFFDYIRNMKGPFTKG